MNKDEDLSYLIIGAAIRIHTKLGPGLLESVYHTVLHRDLRARGLRVDSNRPVSFEFEGCRFDVGFKADLVVENKIVIELKAVENLAKIHERQLLTYVRLMDYRLGLLLNFGAYHFKDGIKRIANGF